MPVLHTVVEIIAQSGGPPSWSPWVGRSTSTHGRLFGTTRTSVALARVEPRRPAPPGTSSWDRADPDGGMLHRSTRSGGALPARSGRIRWSSPVRLVSWSGSRPSCCCRVGVRVGRAGGTGRFAALARSPAGLIRGRVGRADRGRGVGRYRTGHEPRDRPPRATRSSDCDRHCPPVDARPRPPAPMHWPTTWSSGTTVVVNRHWGEPTTTAPGEGRAVRLVAGRSGPGTVLAWPVPTQPRTRRAAARPTGPAAQGCCFTPYYRGREAGYWRTSRDRRPTELRLCLRHPAAHLVDRAGHPARLPDPPSARSRTPVGPAFAPSDVATPLATLRLPGEPALAARVQRFVIGRHVVADRRGCSRTRSPSGSRPAARSTQVLPVQRAMARSSRGVRQDGRCCAGWTRRHRLRCPADRAAAARHHRRLHPAGWRSARLLPCWCVGNRTGVPGRLPDPESGGRSRERARHRAKDSVSDTTRRPRLCVPGPVSRPGGERSTPTERRAAPPATISAPGRLRERAARRSADAATSAARRRAAGARPGGWSGAAAHDRVGTPVDAGGRCGVLSRPSTLPASPDPPDFRAIRDRLDDIDAWSTHGHEDHIGAVPSSPAGRLTSSVPVTLPLSRPRPEHRLTPHLWSTGGSGCGRAWAASTSRSKSPSRTRWPWPSPPAAWSAHRRHQARPAAADGRSPTWPALPARRRGVDLS